MFIESNFIIEQFLPYCKNKDIESFLKEAIEKDDNLELEAALSILIENIDVTSLMNTVADMVIKGNFDENRRFAWIFGNALSNSGQRLNNVILSYLSNRIKYECYPAMDDIIEYSDILKINSIAKVEREFIDNFKNKGPISLTISTEYSDEMHNFIYNNACTIAINEQGEVLNPGELFKVLEILEKAGIDGELPNFDGEKNFIYMVKNGSWVNSENCSKGLFIMYQAMNRP